jgi:hypothetical protein
VPSSATKYNVPPRSVKKCGLEFLEPKWMSFTANVPAVVLGELRERMREE